MTQTAFAYRPDVSAPVTFSFDRERLMAMAADLKSQFEAGEPFPHIHIRDLFPEDVARQIAAEFPKVGAAGWVWAGSGDPKDTRNPDVEKIYCSTERHFPPLIRRVLHELNSADFLDFLSEVTGFNMLIPDPHYGGGGLHSTGRGGRLMIHADSDRHPNNKFFQILNLIYYATPDWRDEWGGALELWNSDATKREKAIDPEFNSAVLFYTGSRCYHGHPHPLTTPPGVRRNSLAVYYYTTDRPTGEDYLGHSRFVTWAATNDHDSKLRLRTRIRRLAEKTLPPALFRKIKGVWIGLKS